MKKMMQMNIILILTVFLFLFGQVAFVQADFPVTTDKLGEDGADGQTGKRGEGGSGGAKGINFLLSCRTKLCD